MAEDFERDHVSEGGREDQASEEADNAYYEALRRSVPAKGNLRDFMEYECYWGFEYTPNGNLRLAWKRRKKKIDA